MFALAFLFIVCTQQILAQAPCPPAQALTKADFPYTFGGNITNPSAYNGTFQCIWTVDVEGGSYVKMSTNAVLGMNDLVQINYPWNNLVEYVTKDIQNDVFFIPAGVSTITFQSSTSGQFFMSLTLSPLPTKSVVSQSVDRSIKSFPLSSVNNSSYYFTTASEEEMMSIGTAYVPTNDTQSIPFPLKSCLIYRGNFSTGIFVSYLYNTYTSAQDFTGPISIVCLTPITYDGIMVVQSGLNTADIQNYKFIILTETPARYRITSSSSHKVALSTVIREPNMHMDMTEYKINTASTVVTIYSGPPTQGGSRTLTTGSSGDIETDGQISTIVVQSGSMDFTVQAHLNSISGTSITCLLTGLLMSLL